MNTSSRQQQQLPDPPREFFLAVREAKPLNLWVKASRLAIPGQPRYCVTVAQGSQPLFASDDVGAIREWLRRQAGG